MFDLNKVDIALHRFSKLILTDSLKTYNETNPGVVFYKGSERVVYERNFQSGEKQIFWVNSNGTDNERIINSKGNDWLRE